MHLFLSFLISVAQMNVYRYFCTLLMKILQLLYFIFILIITKYCMLLKKKPPESSREMEWP